MEAQDQLHLEKLESKRVNKVLDEIVLEVENKAPILKRQREEYENMQKSMSSLCAKLELAMKVCTNMKVGKIEKNMIVSQKMLIFVFSLVNQEVHRLQKVTDEANKRALGLERDNQRSKRQLADMSEQVSLLQ